MSDTPETDAYIGDQNEGLMTEGEFAMCEFARMIERDRNELRHKFETLERENAAMRKAIKEAHEALFGLSNWRNDCDAYDEDMGYPQRDYDEEQVEMMEETAQRSLSKLQTFLKP